MTLPVAGPAFHWRRESWGHALRCRALGRIAQHGFTTRQLELRGTPESHPKIWATLAAVVDTPLSRVFRVRQVHGRGVRVLKRGGVSHSAARDRPDADALIGNEPGIALAVLVADCVPILMADARTGGVAAVHAGWRGTCAGIVGATLRDMREQLGVAASDVVAAIGPSIGPCCYRVGEDVLQAFEYLWPDKADTQRWFSRRAGEPLRLDLWAANRDQLHREGVREQNIFVCGLCTHTHQELFHSFRAEREKAGRMCGVIAVPSVAGGSAQR